MPIKLRKGPNRVGIASFDPHCRDCPLKANCTTSKTGRSIRIHAKEATLQRSRLRQRHKDWKEKYRSTRPKVERKIGHLMQRRHGGRRARVRGQDRVKADFSLLCAATNLKRLAILTVRYTEATWAAFAHIIPVFLLSIAGPALTGRFRPFRRQSPSAGGCPLISRKPPRLADFRWDHRSRPSLTPVI